MKKIKEWFSILRDPCKKCLVGPVCINKNCETFKKYTDFKGWYIDYSLLVFILILFWFLIITFILGLFQWYQIIKSLF